MNRRWTMAVCAFACVVLTLASASYAGKYNKVLSIGDQGPDWAGIVGIDDNMHSLADYKDSKLVVMIFTCNKCPMAIAYEDRLVKLQQDFKEKGVQFVAVNCNNVDADKLPAMKLRAESKGFNFPYLYDESQKSARAYGATVTPHVFLLDQDRKVVYMGAIDDGDTEDNVQHHYLKDAIEASLAGSTIAETETRQRGCGIGYQN